MTDGRRSGPCPIHGEGCSNWSNSLQTHATPGTIEPELDPAGKAAAEVFGACISAVVQAAALIAIVVLLVLIFHRLGAIESELQRRNDIDCTQLRETADSVSQADRDACGP